MYFNRGISPTRCTDTLSAHVDHPVDLTRGKIGIWIVMGRPDGKVAVVTGAHGGIGLASAKRFAREGARLFITGRRQPELDAAVREMGGNAIGVRVDVSNLADLDRLCDVVRGDAGGRPTADPTAAAREIAAAWLVVLALAILAIVLF